MNNRIGLFPYKLKFLSNSRLLWVLSFFCIFFTIYFSPVLFSSKVFLSDGMAAPFYSTPHFWTNLLFSGFPLAAEPAWETFYPLRLLFSLFGNFNIFIVSVFVLASTFMYFYIYKLTSSNLAALIGGIGFSISGFMLVRISMGPILHAIIWLPLIALSLEMLRKEFSYLWVVIGAFAVAMSLLAGHPQLPIYFFYIMFFYVLSLASTAKNGWLNYFGSCFLVMTLGVLLIAFQLLPSWVLADQGVRNHDDYSFFCSFPLAIKDIPTFLFPFIFGTSPYPFCKAYYIKGHDPLAISGYMGSVLILLASIGLYSKWKNKIVLFWALTTLIVILISLGDATPLVHFIYNLHLPFVNKFRDLSRFFAVMIFGVCVLAGFGVAALEKKELSTAKLYWILSIATFIMFSFVILFSLFYAALLPPFSSNPNIYIPVAIFLLSSLSLIIWSKAPRSYWRQTLMIAVVTLDLCSCGWFYMQGSIIESKEQLISTAHATKYQSILNHSYQRLLPTEGPYAPDSFKPNDSQLHSIPSASGYDPLIIKRYYMFSGITSDGLLIPEFLSNKNLSLDILAIKYILVSDTTWMPGRSDSLLKFLKDQNHWHLVERIDNSSMYQNLRAMPRIWWVDQAISEKSEQILTTIQTSLLPTGQKFNPYTTALIEEPFNFQTQKLNQPSTAKIISLSDKQTEIKTQTSLPRFLVLSDIYYPGWNAYIDGIKTQLYRTDYVLRGVIVPSGTHIITFKFIPKSFYLGLGISIIAWMFAILLLAKHFHRNQPSSNA